MLNLLLKLVLMLGFRLGNAQPSIAHSEEGLWLDVINTTFELVPVRAHLPVHDRHTVVESACFNKTFIRVALSIHPMSV